MGSQFVVLVDRPESGVLAGDLITLTPGRPARITRSVPGGSDLINHLIGTGAVQPLEDVLASRQVRPRLRLVTG